MVWMNCEPSWRLDWLSVWRRVLCEGPIDLLYSRTNVISHYHKWYHPHTHSQRLWVCSTLSNMVSAVQDKVCSQYKLDYSFIAPQQVTIFKLTVQWNKQDLNKLESQPPYRWVAPHSYILQSNPLTAMTSPLGISLMFLDQLYFPKTPFS